MATGHLCDPHMSGCIMEGREGWSDLLCFHCTHKCGACKMCVEGGIDVRRVCDGCGVVGADVGCGVCAWKFYCTQQCRMRNFREHMNECKKDRARIVMEHRLYEIMLLAESERDEVELRGLRSGLARMGR